MQVPTTPHFDKFESEGRRPLQVCGCARALASTIPASSYMLKRGNSGGINQVRRPHATPFFSCTLSLILPSTHAQTGSAGGAGRVAACRAQIGA